MLSTEVWIRLRDAMAVLPFKLIGQPLRSDA